jgi:hypothetical protein
VGSIVDSLVGTLPPPTGAEPPGDID